MTAGQLGESGGGFQRSVGESQATGNALQWRLNVRGPPFPLPLVVIHSGAHACHGAACSSIPYPYVTSIFSDNDLYLMRNRDGRR
jgi:hypothetical protein